MVKPEWGTKRQCPSCGARFYDLQHQPVTCPKCQTTFEPEALLKPRRTRPEPVEKRMPRKAVVPDEIEEDQEEELEEEVEDADLEEIEEDQADVLEVEDDAIEEEVEETGARRRRVTALEPEEDLIDIEEAETEAGEEEDEGDILDDAEPLPDEDEES